MTIACPNCNRQVQYLASGCFAIFRIEDVSCQTCADGYIISPPCDDYKLIGDAIVCRHSVDSHCMRCARDYDPSKCYMVAIEPIHGGTSTLIHTHQYDCTVVCTDSRDCDIQTQQCANCEGYIMLDHDGAFCDECFQKEQQEHVDTACGCIIENSTRGRKMRACDYHIRTADCIECKKAFMYVYSHHRPFRFRCNDCMPSASMECINEKCKQVYAWGNVGAPNRTMNTCTYCEVSKGYIGWHHIFVYPEYMRFPATVAAFVAERGWNMPINHALVITASTLEAVHCDHEVFMEILIRNLKKHAKKIKKHIGTDTLLPGPVLMIEKSAVACMVLMQWLPNDIRLKIIDMLSTQCGDYSDDQSDGCMCEACNESRWQ